MDKSNYQNALRLSTPANRSRVTLMRDFDPGFEGSEVPDPYYGNSRNFEEVYDILNRSLVCFIDRVQKHQG